jgi:hypothetical protein
MQSLHVHEMMGVLLLLLFLSSRAFAQNLPPVEHQGSWDFSVWTEGETGAENNYSFKEAQIWSAGGFVGRVITREHGEARRRGNLEYGFDLVPVFRTFGNQRNHGLGFDPLILRWNFAPRTPHILPYIEVAAGVVSTKANLPPGNTSSFNFTAKSGAGLYLWTRRRRAFDIGLHWSHISNANLGGSNPDFTGLQLSVAYHWFK